MGMSIQVAGGGHYVEINVPAEQPPTLAAPAHQKPTKVSPDPPAQSAQEARILVADYSYQSQPNEESRDCPTRADL